MVGMGRMGDNGTLESAKQSLRMGDGVAVSHGTPNKAWVLLRKEGKVFDRDG